MQARAQLLYVCSAQPYFVALGGKGGHVGPDIPAREAGGTGREGRAEEMASFHARQSAGARPDESFGGCDKS
jgi:hypothetical protein